MLVLLCFCVATEFSVNEDLYLNQLTIDFDFLHVYWGQFVIVTFS